VKCQRCQHENSSRAKFCEECASPLARVCASCAHELSASAKFCPECGTPTAASTAAPSPAVVPPPPAQPRFGPPTTYTPKHLVEKILTSRSAIEGERKHVTVLLVDLKGSMELLADRDPEEARNILDPVLELMMEAVHYYEGTVNQVMGDGLMAIFGAPVAHEDHAVRACYAALRMQDGVKRHAELVHRSHGIPIQIRVGMNSGDVVVRSIGNDLHMDYTAVGETTHLAARMEQMALGGTILAAPNTMYLSEGYVAMKSLGMRPVKGLAEPIEIFEVLGATAIRSRLQATAARGLTTFIGRSAELDVLWQGLEHAASGRGQIIALVGEAGVGKSRLFWEFTHSHRTEGWLIVESSSVSYGKATSYLPVIDLLKQYFQIDPRDEMRTVREKITGKVIALDRALEPYLPAIFALLDLPNDDPAWEKLDPPQRRQRTMDGIRSLLLMESRVQPLLILFEDLHWIDTETQALLDGLIESIPSAQILLLVNYRPEYQHAWSRKTYYRQVRVDPLPPEGTDTLFKTLLGTDPALDALKQLLVDRTEGNPFFIEESIRTLVEMRFLGGERGAYRLLKAPESLRIPDSAQAILAARIDRLSSEDKRVLQAAAVIGKDVPFALLEAISEDDGPRLRTSLANLQAAEFLYETTLFPELELTFRHALTAEVAYRSLLRDRRRALHAGIVRAIEHLYPERLAERLERLSFHATHGEVWDKVVAYARQAGVRALGRSSNREAAGFFDQALAALAHLPPSPDHRALEVDLRFDLRLALMPLGDFGRALDLLREGEAIATELGDAARLGWVAGFLTNLFWEMGDQDRAVDSGRRATEIATTIGHAGISDLAFRYLGRSYHALGDYQRAVAHFNEQVGSPEAGASRVAVDAITPSGVLTRVFLMLCLAETGDFGEAMRHGEQSIRAAEALDHPFSLSAARAALGRVHLRRGQHDLAARQLEAALAIADASQIPLLYPFSAAPLGAAYARMGRSDEALELLEQSVERAASMRRMVDQSLWMYWLGEAVLLGGQVERGTELIARARQASVSYGERGYEAWILRLLGDALCSAGQASYAEAEAHYRQSLAMAEARGMRPLIARCHLSLGELHRLAGDMQPAHAALSVAHELCREMDMTFWLSETQTALARIDAAPGPTLEGVPWSKPKSVRESSEPSPLG
jgi:class 3 adenylate cyclase/tetratricopeptide (TPR) repeat protein